MVRFYSYLVLAFRVYEETIFPLFRVSVRFMFGPIHLFFLSIICFTLFSSIVTMPIAFLPRLIHISFFPGLICIAFFPGLIRFDKDRQFISIVLWYFFLDKLDQILLALELKNKAMFLILFFPDDVFVFIDDIKMILVLAPDYFDFSILFNLVFLKWLQNLRVAWISPFVFCLLGVSLWDYLLFFWLGYLLLGGVFLLVLWNSWLRDNFLLLGLWTRFRVFITIEPRIIFIRTELSPINFFLLWLHFKSNQILI